MSERLYSRLPAIHRQRDQEQGEPLRALLAVLEAELEALEGNIEELYDDSFIETCRDWVVPYLGDLAGVEALGPRPHALAHPRSQVADALDLRRRKGTPLALERVSRDRAGWPARVVELFEFLAHTQHIQFPRPAKGGTFDVAAGTDPALPGRDPFIPAEVFHSADIRRAATGPRRFDIPNLALFLWRLKAFAVGDAPAAAAFDAAGTAIAGGFRFDPLGRDLQLFQAPEIDFELVRQAAEEDLPVALGILSLDADLQRFRRRYVALDPAVRPADSGFYGPGTALEVRAGSPAAGVTPVEVVARSLDAWGDAGVMSADLTAFPALRRPRLVVDLSPAGSDPRTVELGDLPADLGDAAGLLEAAIQAASTPGDSFETARVAAVEDRLLILPGDPTHTASAAPLADPDDTTTAGDLALTPGAGAAAVTGLVSGNLGTFPVLQRPELAVTLGVTAGTVTLADLPADLDEAQDLIETAIRAASTPGDSFEAAQVARLDNRLLIVPGLAAGPVTVAATAADATTAVELELAVGEEISGLLGDEPASFPLDTGGVPRVRITLGGTTVETNLALPGNLEEARAFLETAIRLAHPDPAFVGARVVRVGTRLLVLPGVDNTAVTIANAVEGTAVTSITTADALGFTGPAAGTTPLWRGQSVDEFPTLAIAPRVSVTVEQLDGAGTVTSSATAPAVFRHVPGDLEEARLLLEDAVRRAAEDDAVAGTALAAAFRGARATALAGSQQLVLLPGGTATRIPPLADTGSVTTATDLQLTAAATATGGLLSGPLAPFPRLAAAPALAVTLGGEGPHRIALASVPTDIASLSRELELALRGAGPGPDFRDVRVAVVESRVVVVPGVPGDRVVFSAPADDPVTVNALGLDAVSAVALPAAVSGVLDPFPELRRPRLEAAVGGSVRRTVAFADLPADLGGAALLLEDALRQAHTTLTFRGARVRALAASNTLLVLPGDPDDPIAFFAAGDDATTVDELALGAGSSTALTGLLSGDLSSFPALPASGTLDATIGAVGPVPVTLPGVPNNPPADLAEAATQLQTALNGADPSPEFAAARVVAVADRLLVLPGVVGADVTLEPAAADPDTALLLQLDRSVAVTTEALESGDLSVFPAPLSVAPRLALDIGGDAAEAVLTRVPRTLETARAEVEAAIRLAQPASADARFTAAQVLTVGGRLVILAGVAGLAVQVLASAGVGATLDTTTARLLDLAWRLAVDPSRGRFLFAAGQQPAPVDEVRVNHAYGFAAEIGGGPYDRRATLADETAADVFVEVTKSGSTALQDAVDQWAAASGDGVIRILDNEVYEEALQIPLAAGRRLVIEAADGLRPVLAPEPGAAPPTGPVTVTGLPDGSGGLGELVLNGLLVDLPVELVDNLRLVVLHSTLAPRPGRASLSHRTTAGGDASELEVRLASSITGPLPLPSDLASLCVEDSILDAQGAGSGAASLPVLVSDRLGATLRLSAALELEVTLGPDPSDPAALTRTIRLADVPVDLESARQLLEDALHAADTDPSFADASVVILGDRLLVRSGDPADAVAFATTDTDARTVAELKLLAPPAVPVEGLFSGGLDPFTPFTLPRLAVTVGSDGPRVAELSGFPLDPADAAVRLEAAIAAVPASAAFTGTTAALLETTDPAVPIPESRLLVQPGEAGARVRFARTTADAATLAELKLAEPPARAVHGLLGDVLDPTGFKGPEIDVTIGAAGPLTVNLAGLPETLEDAAPFLDTALDFAFVGNEPDVLLLGERMLIRPATANEAVTVTSIGLTETSPATLLGLAEPPAESIVGALLSGVHDPFAGLTQPQIDLTLDNGATVHRATLPEIPGDLAQAAEALQTALRAAAPGESRLATADVLVLDDRLLLLAGGAELDVAPASPEDPDTAGELALVEPPAEDLQGLLSGPVSDVPDFPRPRLEVTLDAAGPQTVTLGELPASAATARSALETAIRDTGSRPAFVDARVGLVGGDRLLVVSGDPSQAVTVEAQIDDGTDPAEDTTTAEDLALVRPPAERVRGLLSGSLLPFPDLGRLHIEATIGGVGPLTVPLDGAVSTLAEVAQSLSDGFEAAQTGVASAEVVQDRLLIRPVSFGAAVTLAAPSRDPDTLGDLQLTTPPAVTVQGLLSGSLAPFPTFPQPELQITLGAAAAVTATLANLPTTLTGAGGAAESLETAIRAAGTGPTFTSATVSVVGDRLFVAPGVAGDSVLVEALAANDPGTAEDLKLLTSTAEAGLLSGDLSIFAGLQDPEVAVSLGGGAAATAVLTALPADLTDARQLLEAAIQTATGTTAQVEISGSQLLVLPATETDTVTVSATAADTTTAGELLLDAVGGTAVTGVYSGVLNPFPTITDPPHLDITIGGATQADVALGTPITSLTEAAASLEAAIQGADPADPNFAQARVLAVGDRLLVLPGTVGAAVSFAAAASNAATVTELALASLTATQGLLSGDLSAFPSPLAIAPGVEATLGGITLTADFDHVPVDLADAATTLQDALVAAGAADPGTPATFTGATVVVRDTRLLVQPGVAGDSVVMADLAGRPTTATDLALTTAAGGVEGLLSGDLSSFTGLRVAPTLDVDLDGATATLTFTAIPTDLAGAQSQLQAALDAEAVAAQVTVVDNTFLLVNPTNPTLPISFQDPADATRTQTATLLELIAVADGGSAVAVDGLLSGSITASPVLEAPPPALLDITIGTDGPRTVDLGVLPLDLAEAASVLEAGLQAVTTSTGFTGAQVAALGDDRLFLLPGIADATVVVEANAANPTLAADLQLDAPSSQIARALLGGVLADPLELRIAPALEVTFAANGPHRAVFTTFPETLDELRLELERAIAAADTDPAFTGVAVRRLGDRFLVTPGADPTNTILFTDPAVGTPAASVLGLTATQSRRGEGLLSGSLASFPVLSVSPQMEVTLENPLGTAFAQATVRLGDVPADLDAARSLLEAALRDPIAVSLGTAADFAAAEVRRLGDRLLVVPGGAGGTSVAAVVFDESAGGPDTAAELKLTAALAERGDGLLSDDLSAYSGLGDQFLSFEVTLGGEGPFAASLASAPADAAAAAPLLEAAIRAAHFTPAFAFTRVEVLVGDRLLVTPGTAATEVILGPVTDDPDTVAALGFGESKTPLPILLGSVLSGDLTGFAARSQPEVLATLGGVGPLEVPLAFLPTTLAEAAAALEAGLRGASLTAADAFDLAVVEVVAGRLLVRSPGVAGSAISFAATPDDDVTVLRLRLDAGQATVADGLLSGDLSVFPAFTASPRLLARIGEEGPFPVTLGSLPGTPAAARASLEEALRAAHNSAAFARARVALAADGSFERLLIVPGTAAEVSLEPHPADPFTVRELGFTGGGVRRVEALVSGALAAQLTFPPVPPEPQAQVVISTAAAGADERTATFPDLTGDLDLAAVAAGLQAGIRAAGASPDAFAEALVAVAGGERLVVTPGLDGASVGLGEVAGGDLLDRLALALVQAVGTARTGDEAGPPLSLERVTVFGRLSVREMELASEVLFTEPVLVRRRETGCVRYSYLPEGSQTARRFRSQPDLALERALEQVTVPRRDLEAAARKLGFPSLDTLTPAERRELEEQELTRARTRERARVLARLVPRFTSTRWGEPGYAQLTGATARELAAGAENGSEMGAFHQLDAARRRALLSTLIDAFLRFGLEAGVFPVT